MLPSQPDLLLLEKAASAARSKRPKGWTTPHRSGSYSFSPPSRTGEEFRSREKGLACAWSKSGAGPGADTGSLSTTGPSQPISTGRARKVVLTGLTARLNHLQSMWWLFPQARSQPGQDQSQFQRGSLRAVLCSLPQQAALSSSLPAAPGEPGGALSTGSSRAGVSNIPLPQLHPGILPTPHSSGHAKRIPLPSPQHFCPVFKELWEEEGVGSRQSSATTHSRLGRTHIHPEASLYA